MYCSLVPVHRLNRPSTLITGVRERVEGEPPLLAGHGHHIYVALLLSGLHIEHTCTAEKSARANSALLVDHYHFHTAGGKSIRAAESCTDNTAPGERAQNEHALAGAPTEEAITTRDRGAVTQRDPPGSRALGNGTARTREAGAHAHKNLHPRAAGARVPRSLGWMAINLSESRRRFKPSHPRPRDGKHHRAVIDIRHDDNAAPTALRGRRQKRERGLAGRHLHSRETTDHHVNPVSARARECPPAGGGVEKDISVVSWH